MLALPQNLKRKNDENGNKYERCMMRHFPNKSSNFCLDQRREGNRLALYGYKSPNSLVKHITIIPSDLNLKEL